jgi:hypothetical protein
LAGSTPLDLPGADALGHLRPGAGALGVDAVAVLLVGVEEEVAGARSPSRPGCRRPLSMVLRATRAPWSGALVESVTSQIPSSVAREELVPGAVRGRPVERQHRADSVGGRAGEPGDPLAPAGADAQPALRREHVVEEERVLLGHRVAGTTWLIRPPIGAATWVSCETTAAAAAEAWGLRLGSATI